MAEESAIPLGALLKVYMQQIVRESRIEIHYVASGKITAKVVHSLGDYDADG